MITEVFRMRRHFLLGIISLSLSLAGCEEHIENVIPPANEANLVTVSVALEFETEFDGSISPTGSPDRLARQEAELPSRRA